MSGNVQWNGKFPIGPVRPEKWSSSKGGPHFPELFQLGRTVPLSFEPKFPEILVEWIAPHNMSEGYWMGNKEKNLNDRKYVTCKRLSSFSLFSRKAAGITL